VCCVYLNFMTYLLAIGKNSSLKTATSNGAAGGTTAFADEYTRAGDSSMGCKHKTTEMHLNVLRTSP